MVHIHQKKVFKKLITAVAYNKSLNTILMSNLRNTIIV